MKSDPVILCRSILAGLTLLADASGPMMAREPTPLAHSSAPDTSQASGGNPLGATLLNELSATRERPIFSPSRRAPSPSLDLASSLTLARSAKAPEPEQPELLLVGTIAGRSGSFGIFLDRATNIVFRLKGGESHKGWTLRAVRGRETVLEKGGTTATMALPAPSLVDNKD